MAIDALEYGMTEAELKSALVSIATEGGKSTVFSNWGDAFASVNLVAADFSLPPITDSMPAPLMKDRVNDIIVELNLVIP